MNLPGLPRLALCTTTVALGLVATTAAGQEPRKVTEPFVMAEPASIVNVVDAFDEGNAFDLHLSLGYQHTWKRADILRETHSTLPQFSSGGYSAGNMKVADYRESTARLNTRADIGLYKDIALFFRLPIILAHDRKLDDLDGSAERQALILQGAPGEQLFRLPFESPTRSGLEYLAVGMNFGIFNQTRDHTKPTWIIGAEGRFNVSEPMRACSGNARALNTSSPLVAQNQVACAHPSDVNRNGQFDSTGDFVETGGDRNRIDLEGSGIDGERSPGVSRGTTALQIHTYVSRRVKYVEPYGGLEAFFEFQNASSDFGQTSLQGSLVNHPPFRGTMIGGMSVYPWEVRERFQRLEIDFRARGTYVSEGRDYSPLFDALGSSDAPSLRRPNFASFQQGPSAEFPSVVNPDSQRVYTTGITGVQQHGVYQFTTQVTFQAGQFIKFNAGGGLTVEQGRIITYDQPCNPSFTGDPSRAGPCRSATGATGGFQATGIPNPNYRPVINVPGRRFRMDDATAFDLWLNATVMF
jgi:hypothetical protein